MTAVAHSRQALDPAWTRVGGYDPRLRPQEESTRTGMEGCSGAGFASGAGLMLHAPSCGGRGCTYSTPGSNEGDGSPATAAAIVAVRKTKKLRPWRLVATCKA